MHVAPSPRRHLVPLVLLLVLPGCYAYHPTTLDALAPGAEVRARLDDAGAGRVEDFTGRLARSVDASLVRQQADTVVFEVWRTDLGDGLFFEPGRVRVPLLEQNVVDVASRRLSVARTGAVVGGVVVGLWFLVQAVWDAVGGSSTGPGGGGEI